MFRTRTLILGCIHCSIGGVILSLRYFGGADLFQWLVDLSSKIPAWGLLATAIAKSVYGIGSYLPGTTVILLNLLGRDCSFVSSAEWVIAVLVGVLIGISISYVIGRLVGVEKQDQTFRLSDFIFGTHPNLTSVYFFERGYWKRAVFAPICFFAVFGSVFLVVSASLVCTFKTFIGDQVQELGVLWGVFLVALGAWRIAEGLFH